MKILDNANSVLTDYEVYQHLVDKQEQYKAKGRKVPANLTTITTDVRSKPLVAPSA